MKRLLAVGFLLVVSLAATCWAAPRQVQAAVGGAVHAHATHEPDPEPHPAVPQDPRWVKPVLGTIGALFLLAIPIGIIVRARMPQEMPVTHSHDEPPGSLDHGHGDDSHGQGGALH